MADVLSGCQQSGQGRTKLVVRHGSGVLKLRYKILVGRNLGVRCCGAVAAVKRALTAGGEEAAQEAASQVAQNLVTIE